MFLIIFCERFLWIPLVYELRFAIFPFGIFRFTDSVLQLCYAANPVRRGSSGWSSPLPILFFFYTPASLWFGLTLSSFSTLLISMHLWIYVYWLCFLLIVGFILLASLNTFQFFTKWWILHIKYLQGVLLFSYSEHKFFSFCQVLEREPEQSDFKTKVELRLSQSDNVKA